MNLDKLRGKITEKRMSQSELAKKMGLSLQAINMKLTGKRTISVPEAAMMIEILEIKNPLEIFFDNYISNMQRNKKRRE